MSNTYLLAFDQGTTSSRTIVFDGQGRVIASAREEFEQILPQPGHVEHDPEAIWTTQLATARSAIAKAKIEATEISAIGIANQRETTVLWDRDSGRPVANAIVWQSRVSAPICDRLKADGVEEMIREKTGLLVDPYFSGTKIKYLLDSIDGLRDQAERGEILFGTIDSFLLWRLTGGKVHATDVSNASRTLLFNIQTMQWDEEILRLLDIPRAMLPEVRPSSCLFGETDPNFFGRAIPVGSCIGDQQSATFGQACFSPGDIKNTYGTGCFMLLNTGEKRVVSKNRLLTTIGWQIGDQVTYCLEGSVFIGGAVVQWLRDGLGLIEKSADVEQLASTVSDSDGVYLVPAFVGLGAPYWDPYARGTMHGLTRGTTSAHIARAALEAIAFQSRDLLEAMTDDAVQQPNILRVDGGASQNNLLMQIQSDILSLPLRRPTVTETTALGAAYMAGLTVGIWNNLDEIAAQWNLDKEFVPNMPEELREEKYNRWKRAVERSLDWER